mgnify:CR=1 FL=1
MAVPYPGLANSAWHDVPLERAGNEWSRELTLTETGFFRAKAYAKVKPLLGDLPADLVAAAKAKPGGEGRYVRIELPRRGTLTLAEVQVLSGGRNLAPQGKAKQSSTSSPNPSSTACRPATRRASRSARLGLGLVGT